MSLEVEVQFFLICIILNNLERIVFRLVPLVSLLYDGSSQSPGFSLKARLGEDFVTVFSSVGRKLKLANDKAAITQKDVTKISLPSLFTTLILYRSSPTSTSSISEAIAPSNQAELESLEELIEDPHREWLCPSS